MGSPFHLYINLWGPCSKKPCIWRIICYLQLVFGETVAHRPVYKILLYIQYNKLVHFYSFTKYFFNLLFKLMLLHLNIYKNRGREGQAQQLQTFVQLSCCLSEASILHILLHPRWRFVCRYVRLHVNNFLFLCTFPYSWPKLTRSNLGFHLHNRTHPCSNKPNE